MGKNPTNPPLTLVNPFTTGAQPPRQLGQHGRMLWDKILAEYRIPDAGGLEILAEACVGFGPNSATEPTHRGDRRGRSKVYSICQRLLEQAYKRDLLKRPPGDDGVVPEIVGAD